MKDLQPLALHRRCISQRKREEVEHLLASVKSEGVLFPLCLYRGMIVDGWCRYQICKHMNIPFQTLDIRLELAKRKVTVEQWMVENFIDKAPDRLSVQCKTLLVGHLAVRLKKKKGISMNQSMVMLPEVHKVTANMVDRGYEFATHAQPKFMEYIREEKIATDKAHDVIALWHKIGGKRMSQVDIAEKEGMLSQDVKMQMKVERNVTQAIADLGKSYRSFMHVPKNFLEEWNKCQQQYDSLMKSLVKMKDESTSQ